MIGSTIRSAKMNAITPAKQRPPDHSTAASGHVADRADEAQHGDDRADDRAPERLHRRGRVVEEEAVEEVVAEQRDEAGEQEAGA